MLETIAFAISIMGVIASVTSTFSFSLVSGVFLPYVVKKDIKGGQVAMLGWCGDGSSLVSS